MLASILGIVNKLLGLIGFATAEIHDSGQRNLGKTQQAAVDLQATIKEDQDARAIEGRNAGADRQQLLDQLRRESAAGHQ